MKKLLILMLVLGMTSLASAVTTVLTDIELLYDGTTVTVVGLNAVVYEKAIGIYDEAGQGTVGPLYEVLIAAGDLGAITGRPAGYNGVDISTLASPVGEVTTGDWFKFAFADGAVGDTMTIYDYAESYTVPAGTLNLIPEPMTIALLGLGGLALLRRRK